ncbi:MAG: hypothetical protein LC135_09635 [Phycisphaerae bacterium]|nr:hypothetical protein [Phycisphaerae bacterium]MCZ2400110.1 hypothetical protein [Phycisphaerae bacterium]
MTTPALALTDPRWRDYVITRGATFDEFWDAHTREQDRRVLFIVGRGFDPRAPRGLGRLAAAARHCSINVVALQFEDELAADSPEQRAAATANWEAFGQIIGNRGTVESKAVQFRNEKRDSIADRSAANLFSDENVVASYTDIVVDVSAMPRVVYFPIISRLIYFHDDRQRLGKAAPNIHVIVSEDPRVDTLIREHGIDEEAKFLHPFEGPFNREARGDQRTVWVPVLGEGRTHHFERMYVHVKPTEVCPVLPSPARNPRRGDDIVMEYQKLLFDEVRLAPRNIMYASESNPFDVYRQIRRTVLHYHQVLGLIGGCRVALSAMCSKLMSLGVLLVAYELKASDVEVGIAHIECQGYDMPANLQIEDVPVGIWVAGECYR